MLKEIIKNQSDFCIEENFIGIGSTRKVYKISDYVIKQNLHPLGYKQSLQELKIYNSMVDNGLNELFAEIYYVDECIAVQKYYKPIEMKNNQSFDIDVTREAHLIPIKYEDILNLLDKDYDSFDLKDSGNYGLNDMNKLVFIDYGMTKSMYENEWVPLAESGELPQIHFDFCDVCRKEKELRMYGKDDEDKRCYLCGKQ
ncbi:protein kinase [Cytobacillus suaedae]|nr:protein kinase [Cytobacillus suaedae]